METRLLNSANTISQLSDRLRQSEDVRRLPALSVP